MSKEVIKGQKETRMVTFQGKLECRAEEDSSARIISGYAAVFDQWSNPIWWFKEQIQRGAFDGCDFSRCVACFNHNTDNMLARFSSGTLKLEVDEVGLRFEFEAPNTTVGNDMYELVKRGDISQCSFAFVVEEDSWKYTEDNELDERTIVKISELWDVSLVTYPAYEGTSVDARGWVQSFDKLLEKKNEHLAKIQEVNIKADSESRARICQVLALGNAKN